MIQLRFRHFMHLKMTIGTSVLWEILMQVLKNGQEWSLNGHLWLINFQVFFLQNCKKLEAKKNVIYVIAFDPIKIWMIWVLQNDSQNLSFVKDINVVGKKMTRYGCKMTISKSCIFFNRTDFSTYIDNLLMNINAVLADLK